MGRHLTEKKKETVENLFGRENIDINFKKVQKHVSTIKRFVDRLKDNGKFNRKKGSGRVQLFKTDIRKILRKCTQMVKDNSKTFMKRLRQRKSQKYLKILLKTFYK